jgi:hypothetical protein
MSPSSAVSASRISPPPRNHESEALALSKYEAEEEARERREAAEKLHREEVRRAEEETKRLAREAEMRKQEEEAAERERQRKAEEERRLREEMEVMRKAEEKREAREMLRKRFKQQGPGEVLLTGSVTVQGGESLVSGPRGPSKVFKSFQWAYKASTDVETTMVRAFAGDSGALQKRKSSPPIFLFPFARFLLSHDRIALNPSTRYGCPSWWAPLPIRRRRCRSHTRSRLLLSTKRRSRTYFTVMKRSV